MEKLLNISGAMNTMKIKTGGIHVVGVEKAKPAPVEEPAEEAAASSEEE